MTGARRDGGSVADLDHVAQPRGADDGLWSPANRNLTVGLVLTITLVAFEALAVSTVMPIVEQELGDIELYGWVFTAFMLGSLIGIVVAGGLIDRRGLGGPFVVGHRPVRRRARRRRPGAVDGRARRRAVRPGPGRRRHPADRLRGHRAPPAGAPAAADVRDAVDGLGHARGHRAGHRRGRRRDHRLAVRVPRPAAAHRASRRSSPIPPCAGSGRPRRPRPAEAAAAASIRRRLPLALLVAAGTGLLLAGHDQRRAGARLIGLVGAGLIGTAVRSRALTPPGTLRAARGLPAAVLMRGILTFTFFGVDAYVALALVDWRGLIGHRGGHRPDRRDPDLDERLVDPGAARAALPARALRPRRAGRRRRRAHRLFAFILLPAVPPVAGRPDVRPRRAGHGPGLLAARAHRPARGARGRAGLGVVRALAARLARDGARDRHHRRPRGRLGPRRRDAGAPGWPPGSRWPSRSGSSGSASAARLPPPRRARGGRRPATVVSPT